MRKWTDLIDQADLIEKAVKFGNGAHIIVPKVYVERKFILILLPKEEEEKAKKIVTRTAKHG